MIAAVNISAQNLEIQKMFSTFAMQTGLIGYPKDLHITAYKAALLRHFCLISRDLFAKLQGRVASFVLLHNQILSQMQTGKNLTQTAPGASCSTANIRQRVTSPRAKSVRKPLSIVAPAPQKTLYQITMDLVTYYDDERGRVRHCSVIHTDIYQAANENEALGLALSVVRKLYGTYRDIDLKSVKRTNIYNIPQISNK